MRIEKRYSKPEILEFYLNRIYFGSGFYGIRSASLGYFGKEPRDLARSKAPRSVGADQEPHQSLADQQSGGQPHIAQLLVLAGWSI
jgi:membrane carboxypeptidase/penicillin-binding protein